MWDLIRTFLRMPKPALSKGAERWIHEQAELVATLVRLQLKGSNLLPIDAWHRHRESLLGYACGMTEHLCAKHNVKQSSPGVALAAIAGVMAGAVTFDEIMESCASFQQGQGSTFISAHQVGWRDLGTLSPSALPAGLSQLLG
jgi:hypothetical protein